MRLELRLPADHPVATEEFLQAEVIIGGYSFTLDWKPPLRVSREVLNQGDCGSDVTDQALTYDEQSLAALREEAPQVLAAATEAFEATPGWSTDAIQETLRTALVDGLGVKPKFAFAPVRVAVTGRRVSPPLFESMGLLGREQSLARLRALSARLATSAEQG